MRFPDKTRGGDLPVHSYTLKYPNPTNKNLSNSWMLPHSTHLLFLCVLQWKCPLHQEKQPLLRETWAQHDREAFPHWASLSHSRRSDTETKAHRPSTGRGLKCLAPRYDLAEMCVATEHFSIQCCVGEGLLSFHKRGEPEHYKRWPSCMTCLSVKPLAESDV